MSQSSAPETVQGLENEIQTLRSLIDLVAGEESVNLSLKEKVQLLNSVGRNTFVLARLLKLQRDLITQQNDPATMLSQTLLELEEEWPEFKALVADYPHYLQKKDDNESSHD